MLCCSASGNPLSMPMNSNSISGHEILLRTIFTSIPGATRIYTQTHTNKYIGPYSFIGDGKSLVFARICCDNCYICTIGNVSAP